MTSRTRVLMDHIFAKKGEASTSPIVRLVTLWIGKSPLSI